MLSESIRYFNGRRYKLIRIDGPLAIFANIHGEERSVEAFGTDNLLTIGTNNQNPIEAMETAIEEHNKRIEYHKAKLVDLDVTIKQLQEKIKERNANDNQH